VLGAPSILRVVVMHVCLCSRQEVSHNQGFLVLLFAVRILSASTLEKSDSMSAAPKECPNTTLVVFKACAPRSLLKSSSGTVLLRPMLLKF
jgi:hypothetical protein